MKGKHLIYYSFETVTIIFGFFLVSFFSFNAYLQIVFLSLTLISYFIIGMVHHGIHHALKVKIVIEYIFVALIILAAFLLLNNTRI